MPPRSRPEPTKIRLILYNPPENLLPPFFLDIPIGVINTLCIRPRKYLRYLGWCILGVDGHIGMDSPSSEDNIGDEGTLVDRGVYHYRVQEGTNPLQRVIDFDVIRTRLGSSHSLATSGRGDFQERLAARDLCCTMTGLPLYTASHIIPHSRGDEFIVNNRESEAYDDNILALDSVDDIRNGILVKSDIHGCLESRQFAFLKTPNHVLACNDVPVVEDCNLTAGTEFPPNERFTLQLIDCALQSLPAQTREELERVCKFGQDAAFRSNSNLLKPSGVLLHYNYGAAAVKFWGHNKDSLQCGTPPAGPPPPPPPGSDTTYLSGPSTSIHDRSVAIRKRQANDNTALAGSSKKRKGKAREQDHDDEWDEDDCVMFFWSTSKVARERRQAAEDEFSGRMKMWASGVADAQHA